MKTTGTPMDGKKIVQVATHLYNAIALASDGTVYGWGNNADGELGNGTRNSSNVPVAVKTTGTPMDGKTIVQIAAAQSTSAALASDGTVYTWGDNVTGQLGDGAMTYKATVPVAVKTTGTPMDGKTIVQISSEGGFHFLALDSNGMAYSWDITLMASLAMA